MSTRPDIFFMAHPGHLQDWFYHGVSKQRAAELGYEVRLNPRQAPLGSDEWAELLEGVDALLTTWGSPTIDAAVLRRNTTLQIVGHVGGSVATVVSPDLYARGVRVSSANLLMSRTVAEWSLTMMLVGLRNLVRYTGFAGRGGGPDWSLRDTNVVPADAVIGIWGYGSVAQWLIELLRPFEPRQILVSDDYLTAETATAQELDKVTVDELFARADVVHCLTGLTPANRGAIGATQLGALKDGAVLLNCGRAALIDEQALIAELRTDRITAIMDVYESEPLADDHPYRTMPNVILTPHNAGCGRDELYLGAMLDEFHRFFHGEPLQMEITQERALSMTDHTLMRGG